MITEITRTDLYALLWEKPVTTLEKELEVSYHELKRICKEKNIPMPESGHWTRVRLGKEIKQAVMGDFDGDDKIDLVRFRTVKRIKMPSPAATQNLPSLPRPTKFEVLVETLKQHLKGKESYSHDGLLVARSGYLDVKVAKENVSRACIILDAFIKMVRKRRDDVIVRNDKSYVVITKHEIQFKLREKLKRVENPKSKYSFDKWIMVSTGLFVVKMEGYHTKEWIDGKILLDHQLENIMLRMEEEGRHLDAIDIRHAKWLEEFHAAQAEKKAIEDHKKREEEDLKILLDNSKRWHEVKMLREYISEMERRGPGEVNNELNEWLRWARGKADEMDPFMQVSVDTVRKGDEDS